MNADAPTSFSSGEEGKIGRIPEPVCIVPRRPGIVSKVHSVAGDQVEVRSSNSNLSMNEVRV
jgi:hypothetical protein